MTRGKGLAPPSSETDETASMLLSVSQAPGPFSPSAPAIDDEIIKKPRSTRNRGCNKEISSFHKHPNSRSGEGVTLRSYCILCIVPKTGCRVVGRWCTMHVGYADENLGILFPFSREVLKWRQRRSSISRSWIAFPFRNCGLSVFVSHHVYYSSNPLSIRLDS